eukprot:TRINITY_DN1420_c0_g1_i6.p1 TRINITY_DN1420_c0_g1~~TRINITY_DN1420_c0_g1_i6.p1  ORF type:complete len:278 (+),score=67.60 TRINITY_DN1420_c0_g1_i6:279-1112(+)
MASTIFCASGGSTVFSRRTGSKYCCRKVKYVDARYETFLSIRDPLQCGRRRAGSFTRLLIQRENSFGQLHPIMIVAPKRNLSTQATTEEIDSIKQMVEDDARERMEKALAAVQSNYNGIRTGRANPALLDRIQIEYYGSPVPLKTIAQVTVPDPSSLLVQPYDKSSLKAIEKAILKSNLGLNPMSDGNIIRVNLPPLTSERRKELLKIAGKIAEEGKVAIRNIRKNALKSYQKFGKEKRLSEDNVRDLSNDFQLLTDEYVKKTDALYKQKEKELTTI